MTPFLLDTNIASFLIKQMSTVLLHRVSQQSYSSLAICTVTEAELRYGMQRMPRDARVWTLVPAFLSGIAIQPWDSPSADRFASLTVEHQRAGTLSNFDAMIAAHALAHDSVLVSNDAAFRQVKGLRLEDWTKGTQRT